MENILIVCLNSVLPVFLTMAVGFAARLAGLIGERDVSRMNAIAFKVFLPLMLFYNIYSSDISYAVRPKLIGFTVGCVFVIFALCLGYVLLVEKDKSRQGVMIQGLYRSNFVIVGLPVAQALMGDADLSVVAVLMAIVVPIFNILAVITLEVFRGNKVKPWKIFLEVLENPLLIGSVVGILFVVFKIQLPGPVKTVVGNLAGIASPLMLFLLGAFFRFENMRGHVKELVQVCLQVAAVLQLIGKGAKNVCYDGVEDHVGAGDGAGGAGHAEFKLVAREGKGAGTVAVGGIQRQLGQDGGADVEL